MPAHQLQRRGAFSHLARVAAAEQPAGKGHKKGKKGHKKGKKAAGKAKAQ